MSRNIEIAVFDLAGTTVKETGLVESAIRSISGDAFDAEAFHASRGGSKRDMLVQMLGEHAADDALAHFDDALIDGIQAGRLTPLPHAEQAFTDLRRAGIKVVLITGFSERVQRTILDRFGWHDLVDLAVSPGGSVRGRPYPDLILTAALALHATSVSSVAVVGDTYNDAAAAVRAGSGICAVVLTGAHDRSKLAASPATHILDNVGDFAALVLQEQA